MKSKQFASLTPRQQSIVEFVREYTSEHGYAPTLSEIAEDRQVCKVTIFEHIEALIKKGVLAKERDKARSITVVGDPVVPWRALEKHCPDYILEELRAYAQFIGTRNPVLEKRRWLEYGLTA